MSQKTIDKLRLQITTIDKKIFKLTQQRLKAAQAIGEIKNNLGNSIRDFSREKDCMFFAQRTGAELNLSANFTQNLMQLLIKESLTSQEKNRISQKAMGQKKTALVIGGAGKMGLWFAKFLASQGFNITISDPSKAKTNFENCYNDISTKYNHDIIVVATPLVETCTMLKYLAKKKPRGLVLDIASLKEPIIEGIKALQKAKVKTASIHPMFGPSVEMLSKRHIILIDLANAKENNEIKNLFQSTMAELISMKYEEHDRNMAYLLGLSHILNIAFAATLSKSGEQAPILQKLSSSTFDTQLKIAAQIATENPHLYFDIQALNPYNDAMLNDLLNTLAHLKTIIKNKKEKLFINIIASNYEYLKNCKSIQEF